MTADDTGDYKIIRPTSKSSFEEVRLYEETLLNHIPVNHPELKLVGTLLGSNLLASAIEEAIVNPTKLHQSVTSATSEVFASSRFCLSAISSLSLLEELQGQRPVV